MTGRPYRGMGLRHTIVVVFRRPDQDARYARRPQPPRAGLVKRALLRGLTGVLLIGLGFADAATTNLTTANPVTVNLETFLEALAARPELGAAEAGVRAAEANLAAARPPAALDVSASSPTLATGAPLRAARLEVGVTAYPLPYGQLGDTVRLRELELEGARLDLRGARAQLEARALTGALDLELARQTLTLARAAAAAADRGLETAQLRRRRELVTAGALRDAAAARQRAQNLVANAEADLTFAENTLTSLVGNVRLNVLPQLGAPTGTPQSLRRAELALAAARVSEAGTNRQFYPVAELDYAYETSPQSRVTASVSSSDLAPRLAYSFSGDGYAGDAYTGDSALSVRISATFSPEQFQNAARLGELLGAARENLRAAQQNALSGEAALRNRQDAANREHDLGALVFRNAERTLQEVRERETLGVGTPLETQAAAVALAEAGLELRDARREQFTALLDLFALYGLPVSELARPTASDAASQPAAPEPATSQPVTAGSVR